MTLDNRAPTRRYGCQIGCLRDRLRVCKWVICEGPRAWVDLSTRITNARLCVTACSGAAGSRVGGKTPHASALRRLALVRQTTGSCCGRAAQYVRSLRSDATFVMRPQAERPRC